MHRRAFLQSAAAASGLLLFPNPGRASQGCGQIVPTPMGPLQRCTAGVDSVRFQSAFQEEDEWCWAASISMVFSYYGHPVSQTRIVAETWGQIVDMPAQPTDIIRDLNRTWVDDNGRRFQSIGDPTSANAFNAVVDLRNNQPLIIGAFGHATVLTALTADTNVQTGAWQIVEAVVRDPWPTNGARRVLSAQEWMGISFAARIRVI